MDKEDSIRLIQLYGSYKMLWDSKDPDHLNKSKREDCWRKISDKLKLPVSELKRKLESLSGSYRREKSREKKSITTGLDSDVYVSKWFGFKYFDFMSNKNYSGITQDGGIDNDCGSSSETGNIGHGISDTNASASKGKPAKKRTYQESDIEVENEMISLEHLRNQSDIGNDSYVAFGMYISSELRKYDAITLTKVKHAINNIIYEADMACLNPIKQDRSHRNSTET